MECNVCGHVHDDTKAHTVCSKCKAVHPGECKELCSICASYNPDMSVVDVKVWDINGNTHTLRAHLKCAGVCQLCFHDPNYDFDGAPHHDVFWYDDSEYAEGGMWHPVCHAQSVDEYFVL